MMAAAAFDPVAYKQALIECRGKVREFIDKVNCQPILVRLAWHDSGTYDKATGTGGADGSIRFEDELKHGANAGLSKAMGYVENFKKQFPILSYADIIQMCSAESILLSGGPKINMRYGRIDANKPAKEGNLPDAMPPFKGEPDAATHLRNVFHRMGFNDQEIVALSGAHTLGRAFKERSGVTEKAYGSKGTKYTSGESHVARKDNKADKGMLGGQSWTVRWLKFDNSYFKPNPSDKELLWLPTDDALRTDKKFKPYFEKYAASEPAFFADYAEVHRKLSELGSKFIVPGGISIDFDATAYRTALQACRVELRQFIDKINCHPILVRLAWHDSGTYDVRKSSDWPACGGANGSIRFAEELAHGANAGLSKAIGYLTTFKEKYPILSWADLIQMASAEAIELIGGPKIPMRYGRVDALQCPKEGNLPDAMPPFKGEKDAATHLRNVFYRMGFDDRAIVALSGAHTIGRAFKERSGTTENGYGSKGTKYTSNESHVARPDGNSAKGMLGGRSWTANWLTFDNSYFTTKRPADELMWLPTDQALQTDPSFKEYFELYSKSKEAFFRDYADAHKTLSELGSVFYVPGGITISESSRL